MEKHLGTPISEREERKGWGEQGGQKTQHKKIPSDIAHTAASIKVEQMDNLSKASSQLPLSLSLSLLLILFFLALLFNVSYTPSQESTQGKPSPHKPGINAEQITAAP